MIRTYLKLISFVCILLLTLMLLACSPAALSGYKPMTSKDNVNSEIPLNMEVWKNGVIHIEATDNIQSVKDRIRMTEIDLLQSKEINWGTALLIKHLNRYFLVTSRQVIHDTEAGANYLRDAGSNISPTWADDFRKDHIAQAQEMSEKMVYKVIYKVPSIREFQTEVSDGTLEFLIGLGDQPYETAPYSFSSSDLDLAIISLDRYHSVFTENLIASGYHPVSSDLIGMEPSSKKTEIFTVGYPIMPTVFEELKVDSSDTFWQTGFTSVATFAFGRVKKMKTGEPVFECELDQYSGDLGGPVVENDHLVGIVQSKPVLKDGGEVLIRVVKAYVVHDLLLEQLEKDRLSRIRRNSTR